VTDDVQKLGQLIARAWADDAFLNRLKNDPKAAMKELGLTPPDGEVRVVVGTADKTYLVIPPKPAGELSDRTLDAVAGGSSWDAASKMCW
jgi:hypothetical protein